MERTKHNRVKGSGSLYRRGRIYWMAATVNGVNFRESTGKTTKGEAQLVLTAKLAEAQSGAITTGSQKTTVRDLVEAVIRDYTINGQKSLRDVKQRWEQHLQPAFGNLLASKLSPPMIEAYKAKRLQDRVQQFGTFTSNATVNRELALLRRAFHLGHKHNRVSRIPHFSLLAEAKPRVGFLDETQYQRLADACAAAKDHAPWLRAFFEVAGQLSNRKAELLNLRVGDIDFGAGSIMLHETKNGERRVIPMTQSVRALLTEACAGKDSDDAVFTWPDGRRVRDFRITWKAVTELAGVPGLKVHDLRRTGIRNMVRRGVSEQIAMRISGHKTQSVFRRYNIISDDDLRHAANLIENGRGFCTVDAQQSAGTRENGGN